MHRPFAEVRAAVTIRYRVKGVGEYTETVPQTKGEYDVLITVNSTNYKGELQTTLTIVDVVRVVFHTVANDEIDIGNVGVGRFVDDRTIERYAMTDGETYASVWYYVDAQGKAHLFSLSDRIRENMATQKDNKLYLHIYEKRVTVSFRDTVDAQGQNKGMIVVTSTDTDTQEHGSGYFDKYQATFYTVSMGETIEKVLIYTMENGIGIIESDHSAFDHNNNFAAGTYRVEIVLYCGIYQVELSVDNVVTD